MSSIPRVITLNDGHQMPAIGLGTFQGNYDYTAVHDIVVSSTKRAIDMGYRHIDTATVYDTEKAIGEAIKEKIQEGVVTREDLFVTTKLWCTSHRRDLVVSALRKSLEILGLDYVNMYLIHWPCALKPGDELWPKDEAGEFIFEDDITDITETWQGMEDCQKLGLTRSIGVSNFNKKQLRRILDKGTVKPAAIQIEVNPFFSNEALVDFCREEKIAVVCFSPLHKPNRTWAQPGDPFISTDETLLSLAKKYNKSPVQIALRSLIQRGLAVLPKSNSAEHQLENISIFDFELSDEDLKSVLIKCNRNCRVLVMKHLLGRSVEFPFEDVV